MNGDKRKEMKNAYRRREVTGGVVAIRCSGNNRVWVQATANLDGLKNRFNFAMLTKTAPDPSMRNEWSEYGTDSFSFTVLEQLTKKEEQTDKEFADDIELLLKLWLEKAESGDI